MDTNRRSFLNAGAAAALSYGRILGANERVRVAGLGTGNRGTYVMSLAVKAGVDVVAVCDIYGPRRAAAREKLSPAAQEYVDYREVLDRKDVDAVFIGSPDHWHVPMTIDAVKAGKDVYVEKPVSHTIEEGQRLETALADSRQVVQVGYQQRSWEHFKMGREVVASGKLGKVTLILTSWYQNYLTRTDFNPKIDTAQLDWKRFLGSAPDQPFHPLRYTKWRWFWDFGGGHLTDLYSHYGDVIHWYMGEQTPLAAQAMGSRSSIPQFECPDTINACYSYPTGFNVVYNGALNCALDAGNILFRGTRAMMKINRDGFAVYPEGAIAYEKTTYPEPEISMRSLGDGTVDHVKNFLDCVRSRKAPNAGVSSSVAIARAAHLGNMAYRKGARVENR